VVEVPVPSNKKWMKNKKKAGGKKGKKKSAGGLKGGGPPPVKKTSVANSVPSTAASTSSLASSVTDVVERKDKDVKSASPAPADTVIVLCIHSLSLRLCLNSTPASVKIQPFSQIWWKFGSGQDYEVLRYLWFSRLS